MRVKTLWMVLLFSCSAAAAQSKPNVLILIADDLGWAGVGYHHGFESTPNIDRIASSGVQLDRFYTSPMCSPTRAGIMTGRYPIRFGMGRSVVRPWDDRGIPANELTIAQAFAAAGYADRIALGKWHLGHLQTAFHPLSKGFTYFFGCYNGAADYFTRDRDGQIDWHDDFNDVEPSGYTTEIIGDAAVKFIESHTHAATPFFAYVAFTSVHEPLQAPEKYLVPFFKDGHSPSDKEKLSAMDACMDDQIGRILTALRETHLAENTIIWFLSDNGGIRSIPGNNFPLRAGKLTVYEGGVRTPSAVWWPGHIEGGRVVATPIINVDLLPTLLAAAGSSPNSGQPLDGMNMLATLTDKNAPQPQRDLYFFTGQDGVDNEQLAVTSADGWKLIVKGPDIRRGASPENHSIELFNLIADQSEKSDESKNEPKRVKELSVKLLAYRQSEPAGADASVNRKPDGFVSPAHWHVAPPTSQRTVRR